ncbi:MAG: acetyl-CoA hydrolase/transferase C-terminal domain-containing protein [Bdellovibrionales bacterium]
MVVLNNVEDAVEQVIQKIGSDIVLGTPLGAGKPNQLINSLYDRVKKDSAANLNIITALSLQKPFGKTDLEKRFLKPFVERVFGDYPDLDYEKDRVKGCLPKNIKVTEFYFAAGKFLNNPGAQQSYLSTNYTHVARDAFSKRVNLVFQQVCKGEIDGEMVYSLSCNSDITIELVEKMKKSGEPFCIVAQVNQELPFMYGESVVGPEFFDIVVDNRDLDCAIFSTPKMSVNATDYMIGLHASTLVKDDGEIQIGIGCLGDALVYSLCLRHEKNETYQKALTAFKIQKQDFPILEKFGGSGVFNKGLFAATEMFVDSFMNLYQAKILKKKVYDSVILQRLLNEERIQENFKDDILDVLCAEGAVRSSLTKKDVQFLKDFGVFKSSVSFNEGFLGLDSGESVKADLFDKEALELIKKKALGAKLRNGAVAHAGFFVGPRNFYQFLKDLPIEERKLIRMKQVSQINQLYGHEEIDRLQRKNGRFINTCMKVTLNGSAASDALEDGGQISGVGGQYNFVAMAHELPDAKSVLQLRSTRVTKTGDLESNIVFNYGNCTIPRHLRDVVITEYGIADLRGKTDEEVAIALIQIADSSFQEELIRQAQKAQKIKKNFKLSKRFSDNTPLSYTKIFNELRSEGLFPVFPFGTDFTEDEISLGKALKFLKAGVQTRWGLLKTSAGALLSGGCPDRFSHLLERMDLSKPQNVKERLYKKILVYAFKKTL